MMRSEKGARVAVVDFAADRGEKIAAELGGHGADFILTFRSGNAVHGNIKKMGTNRKEN